jgi:hypothetical protein
MSAFCLLTSLPSNDTYMRLNSNRRLVKRLTFGFCQCSKLDTRPSSGPSPSLITSMKPTPTGICLRDFAPMLLDL